MVWRSVDSVLLHLSYRDLPCKLAKCRTCYPYVVRSVAITGVDGAHWCRLALDDRALASVADQCRYAGQGGESPFCIEAVFPADGGLCFIKAPFWAVLFERRIGGLGGRDAIHGLHVLFLAPARLRAQADGVLRHALAIVSAVDLATRAELQPRAIFTVIQRNIASHGQLYARNRCIRHAQQRAGIALDVAHAFQIIAAAVAIDT